MTKGRPLKFGSVEELQQKIDEYFSKNLESEWTITGLALALGTYRDVLIDYQEGKYDKEDRDFSNTVKKAKEMVHNSYEKDLRRKGRSGDIFALKNFGWKDKTETDIKTDGKPLGENIAEAIRKAYGSKGS